MNEVRRKPPAEIAIRGAMFENALQSAVEMQGRADTFPGYLDGMLEGVRVVKEEMESHAAEIQGFETWYAPHRNTFLTDPLMQWALGARNKEQHPQDFAEHSSLAVELVATFRKEPLAAWSPTNIYASIDDMLSEISPKHLTQHVRENGVLCIHRRWIDSNLPDWDVVTALNAINNRISNMIFDLFSKDESRKIPMRETGDAAAAEQIIERTTYVSVNDGRILHASGVEAKPASTLQKSMGRKLQDSQLPQLLKNATKFDSVARILFEFAAIRLHLDGSHPSIAAFIRDRELIDFQDVEFTDRAHKYALIREQALHARHIGADAVIYMVEAWVKPTESLSTRGHGTGKGAVAEVLMLFGAAATGSVVMLESPIRRGFIRRRKIKPMDEPRETNRHFPGMLTPFIEQWGCLDAQSLPESTDFALDTIPRT